MTIVTTILLWTTLDYLFAGLPVRTHYGVETFAQLRGRTMSALMDKNGKCRKGMLNLVTKLIPNFILPKALQTFFRVSAEI